MTEERYVLTAAEFAGLAAGNGSPSAMRVLRRGQATKRRQLLLAFLDEAGSSEVLRPATDLLLRVDRLRPDASAELLARPHVDAWLTRCLRLLAGEQDGAGRALDTDLGHLAAIAAAAAVRAGIAFSIWTPTIVGEVCLPGLGVAGGLGDGPASVESDGRAVVVTGATGTRVVVGGTGWNPLRTVEVEFGFTVDIEDQDPYRDAYQLPLAGRLAEQNARVFADLLVEAWSLIRAEYPLHANTMRHWLRSIVPLQRPASGQSVSAASRQTVGSVALAVPETAGELGLLLIHEHLHDKLGGLLDLVDLHQEGTVARHHAPWRMDSRPVGQLLQGVYAHFGVTDYWRVRRLAPAAGTVAALEFAYWREQTRLAVETLRCSTELTPEGERFVAGLAHAMRAWDAEVVEPEVSEAVLAMVTAQTVRWRLHNWAPTDDEVRRVVRSWAAGMTAVDVAESGTITAIPSAAPAGMPGLVGHIRSHVIRESVGPTDPVDAALLSGDRLTALRGYVGRLDSDIDAWAGLAIAIRPGDFPLLAGTTVTGVPWTDAELVRNRPDLVRAAYAELSTVIFTR